MKFLKINVVCILVAVMFLSLCACGNKKPDHTEPEQPTTQMQIHESENNQTAFLGDNLYITDIGNYTGAYMEDGSDEIVTNVLMIVLKNEGQAALQLARIKLEYSDFTANFEVTNLPAGESVVLLEKNRHDYVPDHYRRATAENVVFFQEPMSLQEQIVKVSGTKGAIVVENLTEEPLGEIYIYYKNSAVDLLYGGITYRARVDAGLKPGRSTTVMTNHYNPKTCTILNVQILPVEEQ
jgi:hypothetical protein